MEYNENTLVNLLKEKGLKVTTQRKVILEVLASKPEQHLTAEEIYELVKNKNPEIGLATIYRTIQLLSELRLIDKLSLGDGYVRYEIGKNDSKGHHHHHLICLECGKIDMFADDMLEDLEEKIYKKQGFKVTDHEVKIYGYCKECLENKKNEK